MKLFLILILFIVLSNNSISLCNINNFHKVNKVTYSENEIVYLSPVPNSIHNPSNCSIIVRLANQVSLSDIEIITNGSISGLIDGNKILSDDYFTIIFKPNRQFTFGEKVDVKIVTNSDTYSYSFFVEREDLQQYSLSKISLLQNEKSFKQELKSISKIPKIITKIYNENAIAKGKLFLSAYGVINQTFQSNPAINSTILIAENDGTIIYSKDIGSNKGAGLTDFKMHPNGYMSYPKVIKNYQWTGGAEVIHMVMDKNFAVIDSFQMGNGYTAETHDFQLLPNGHALLMAYYLIPIDLSNKVPNSHPNAYIDGAVIQELDTKKNVVFQWRTWDYINTNLIPWQLVPGNTQQIINVFHLNSLRLDSDGNLLLGTVGMGIKVSRQTGKIMWIIGGIMNQFTFSNVTATEAIGDFGGHTFQRLPNGNILVLDNSPFPWQQGFGNISSEVVEYKIDEEKKTAELVWKYVPDKVISGWHAGSVQRLDNGNTLICWGGPPYENGISIPIATEVTQKGEKVFELFYDGTELESYRAFRFDLDIYKPILEITKELVMASNTYYFKKNENEDTGISIKLNTLESVGYNLITTKKFNSSPLEPKFDLKPPILLNGRIVISSFGISSLEASLRFDTNTWNIKEPNNTIIYYRPQENIGTFTPLETTYNFVTGVISANIKELGEFVIGKPDLISIPYPPIPNSPLNNTTVNYKLPITISWSPVGIASSYSLQVSNDETFQNLLIDENNLSSALYKINNIALNNKYYWRVKTRNNAGESDWCKTQLFTAVEPFIKVKKPNGNERWHIGLDYYIQWDKNIIDTVNVFLIKKNEVIKSLTKTTNSFYLWEIDIKSILANDYKIKVMSNIDSSLYDISDSYFSIVDTVTSISQPMINPTQYFLYQNYPNPFNSATTLRFYLPESNYTYVAIYNSLGQELELIVNKELTKGNYTFIWDANNYPSGIYFCRMKSGNFIDTKKILLLK